MKEKIKNTILNIWFRIKFLIKWVIFALLSGLVIGAVGTLFYYCMKYATDGRTAYPWLLFFLPLHSCLPAAESLWLQSDLQFFRLL